MTQLLARVRARLTYANLTATLALFIALGGTSYAALTLPRNSVGSTPDPHQRRRPQRDPQPRRRLLRAPRPQHQARRHLHQRPHLAPRRPRPHRARRARPRVTYRAAVTTGGGSVRGNAIDAGHTAGTNEYHVVFARNVNVSGCIYNATLAAVQNGPTLEQPPAGRITVADGPDARTVTRQDLRRQRHPRRGAVPPDRRLLIEHDRREPGARCWAAAGAHTRTSDDDSAARCPRFGHPSGQTPAPAASEASRPRST